MQFVQEVDRDGLRLYEFAYTLEDLDKTQYFPADLIGEREVIGSHSGKVWVEPVSGEIVRFEHQGENFFFENGEQGDLFQEWYNVFPESVIEQRVQTAIDARNRLWMLHYGVTGALILIGALALGLGFRKK